MATMWIDGAAYEAKPSKNLLDAILELGFDLPYFCWHPALGSIGACRQCAITQFQSEDDDQGRVVMACMTPAAEGARVSIRHPQAEALRRSVIEWMMLNHPHDCPVCDEGGECHLQDMTVMTGHAYRRSRFPKRTYVNQYLGPLIQHEMNRCIQCYRCVRFYRDYAGGSDLQDMGSRDRVYFGRREDGVLESVFAGNLVEVCPTGVFTDKTQGRHYARKWDLQSAPSVCAHCAVGCNTIPGDRGGALRRVRARYHGSVNGHFLCDRGRYGYEFDGGERRVRTPLAPRGEREQAEGLSEGEARARAARILASSDRVIGVGSPRATLESNFALQRLVGEERFYHAVCAEEHAAAEAALAALRTGPARTPALRDIEDADAAVVLGEDPTHAAPLMALALRQAALSGPRREAEAQGIPAWHDAALRGATWGAKSPIFVVSPRPTEIDDIAAATHRATPSAIVAAALEIATALDESAPPPPQRVLGAVRAREIATALASARRPMIVAGAAGGTAALARAAANVAWASARARPGGAPAELAYSLPWVNSAGLSLLGGAPIESALAAAERGEVDAAILLECDLSRAVGRAACERFTGSVGHTIVLDHIAHPTAAQASVVLPAATFAEGHGHVVNNEGRAQRQLAVRAPEAPVRESWRWIGELAELAGAGDSARFPDFESTTHALTRAHSVFADLPRAQFSADYRIAGAKVARAPHRYSGRSAAKLHLGVLEPIPPLDPDTPLAYSMEGSPARPPGTIEPVFWAPAWNSPQALTRFQEEIGGRLRGGDPGVRLIEPPAGAPAAYLEVEIPALTQALEPAPLFFAFGSEEQSALAPGIAALAPAPHVELNPDDAGALGAADGDIVEIRARGASAELPVRVEPERAPGSAGIPIGLGDVPIALARRGEVRARP